QPIPEDGYQGEYITEIATRIRQEQPDAVDLETFRTRGVEMMFAEIKRSLLDFGVHFDVYFNEKELHDKGALEAALKRLSEQDNTYSADGAIWVRTSEYGDDKDRVI